MKKYYWKWLIKIINAYLKKANKKKNPKNKVIALIALLSARISQGHYYTGIY